MCGTGVWVFGEHLVSHGHTTSGSIANFLAFVIYFAAAPLAAVRIWPRPMMVWGAFGAFVSIMAVVFVVSSQPPEESKSNPHFKFELFAEDDPDHSVKPTNDFLRVLAFSDVTPAVVPVYSCLVMPRHADRTNVELRFVVKSDKLSEGTQITISVPTVWNCVPGTGWIPMSPLAATLVKTPTGIVTTNFDQSWLYPLPLSLLPGNGEVTPTIQISQLPNPTIFSIMARDNNSVAGAVSFNLFFAPTSSVFLKPFVILGKDFGRGQAGISITPEQLKELQK